MKSHLLRSVFILGGLATLVVGGPLASAEGAMVAVRDYPGANLVPNISVDSNVTLAQFTTDVAAAFDAGLGGIVDFSSDDPNWPNETGVESFDVTYAGGNKTLTVTKSAGTIVRTSSGVATPILGTSWGAASSSATFMALTFSEPLVEIGITMISRNGDRTYNAVVRLDDDTTHPFQDFLVAGATGVTGESNTFMGYKAPAGRTIVGFDVAKSVGGNNMAYDALAFVTVPEPSSILLAAFGLSAVAAGRRLRRRRQA